MGIVHDHTINKGIQWPAQNKRRPRSRWSFLQAHAKKPEIGILANAAMDAIEKDNPSLKGVLPKVYARQNFDPASLGGLA